MNKQHNEEATKIFETAKKYIGSQQNVGLSILIPFYFKIRIDFNSVLAIEC